MTGVEQLIKEATELCKKIEALANELLVSRLPKEVTTEGLSDSQIAEFWEYDLSAQWVRETLARRIRDAGYIVVLSAGKEAAE